MAQDLNLAGIGIVATYDYVDEGGHLLYQVAPRAEDLQAATARRRW
jgi:hypothetical protein